MAKRINYSDALAISRVIWDDKNNFYSERVRGLTPDDIVDVINAYLRNSEEEPKQENPDNDKAGPEKPPYFPGDCCD